ncbi:peptidoglycan-binding protein [Streptomyces sp. NPDC096136]|uniref:peptidoglycan-binding domain-containing protein n=1 Tax=Streptomyces sp. NPDC096136 TaxID=3366076 RepID=UPI00382991EC
MKFSLPATRTGRVLASAAVAGLVLTGAAISANAESVPPGRHLTPQPEWSIPPVVPLALRPGTRGEAVSRLQERLALLGSPVKTTGVFDSATVAAVKYFQKAHGLEADGVVGPKTRASLEHSPGAAVGGDRAALAQQIMNRHGITPLDAHSKPIGGPHLDSTALSNIRDTGDGKSALTSSYGDAHGERVELNERMLRGLLQLNANHGFSLNITEVAGGDHSRDSLHYKGVAFDTSEINGVHVALKGKGRELAERLESACYFLGASQVLGPGYPEHDTHVHCAWNAKS